MYMDMDMDMYMDQIADQSFQTKLFGIHDDLRRSHPDVHRIAIAVFHEERGTLQTFAVSEDKPSQLFNYEAGLNSSASLIHLMETKENRVVNDLSIFNNVDNHYTTLIRQAGFSSSFTMPLVVDDKFIGFLFANSRNTQVFKEELTNQLKLVAMVLALLIHQNLVKIDILKSTVDSIQMMTQHRDPETGGHLQRMAAYTLLIAREIQPKYQFTDLYLNFLYIYAPLHDIGKLIIPDTILLKPDKLTREEFDLMKRHTIAGEEIVRSVINLYDLAHMPLVDDLFQIVRSHHEKLDGSGYPDGLMGDQISISARIIAVADIFDALTSVRSYKSRWSNQDAYSELKKMAGQSLDTDCVMAICNNHDKINQIQNLFEDEPVNF